MSIWNECLSQFLQSNLSPLISFKPLYFFCFSCLNYVISLTRYTLRHSFIFVCILLKLHGPPEKCWVPITPIVLRCSAFLQVWLHVTGPHSIRQPSSNWYPGERCMTGSWLRPSVLKCWSVLALALGRVRVPTGLL